MFLLGAAYAVFTAAIWPSMYLEVNEEHRATAFAFASAAKNVALCLTPLAIGFVRNRSPNYDNVETLLVGGGAATLVLCLALGCINANRRGSRGHLNAPTYATIQSPATTQVPAPLPAPLHAPAVSAFTARSLVAGAAAARRRDVAALSPVAAECIYVGAV